MGTATAMSGKRITIATMPPIRPTTTIIAAASQSNLIYIILRNNFSSKVVPAATKQPSAGEQSRGLRHYREPTSRSFESVTG
jgi:hypothetical protein